MTLEEADKKIGFILQMQAQFEAGMGKLRDSQAALTVSVAEIAGVLRESVRISDDRFTRLAEMQHAADERLTRLETIMSELAESQKATDDRLNALINVVERHITGPDHRPPAQ
jgi:hypothetical protein